MAITDLLSRNDYSPSSLGALLGLKGGVYSATLSGTATLDNTYPSILMLDPGGANRDVTLDTESTHDGLLRLIVNRADNAENLVFKETSGDGGSTIATANQNEAALLYCDGSSWTLVCIFTIVIS